MITAPLAACRNPRRRREKDEGEGGRGEGERGEHKCLWLLVILGGIRRACC